MFKYKLSKKRKSFLESKNYTTSSLGLFFSFLIHKKRTFFKSIKNMFLFKYHSSSNRYDYIKRFIKLRGMMFSFNLKLIKGKKNLIPRRDYNFLNQREMFRSKVFGIKRVIGIFLLSGYNNDKLFFKKIKNINNLFHNFKFSIRSFISYYFRFFKLNSVWSSHKRLNMFTINNICYKNFDDFYLNSGDVIKFFFSNRLIRYFFNLQIKKIKNLSKFHTVNRLKSFRISRRKLRVKKKVYFKKIKTTRISTRILRLYKKNTWLLKKKKRHMSSFLKTTLMDLSGKPLKKEKKDYAALLFGVVRPKKIDYAKRRRRYRRNKENFYRKQTYKYGFFSLKDMEVNNLNFSAVKIYKANFYKNNFFFKQFVSVFSWRLHEWDRK